MAKGCIVLVLDDHLKKKLPKIKAAVNLKIAVFQKNLIKGEKFSKQRTKANRTSTE